MVKISLENTILDKNGPKTKHKAKRMDLQGIRGLAIISVLAFHFYPFMFPNGYLGVDQFFVLSGFLMCMLLKKSENQPSCTLVTTFYSRRFKRILPLYFLIIAVAMIALYIFFPETAIETNQQSALYALLFVSNRPKTASETYFEMLSTAVDIFTHTWSLSVEIQFYFLVPFIFILGNRFPSNVQYSYYTFIGSISLCYHFILPSSIAFNSVFARIWQFTIGMVVYLITESMESITKQNEGYVKLIKENPEEGGGEVEIDEDEEEDIQEISIKRIAFFQTCRYLLLISMAWIVTYPFELPAIFSRPYFTIATGVLMCFSMEDIILSNRFLTYIGDISYSLYLIHWPIYAYWKLTMDNNQIALIFCIFVSIFLAVLVFETYEKWYLKLSSTSIGCLVVILVIFNVIIINKDEIKNNIVEQEVRNFSRFDEVTENMTLDDAVRLNYQWSVRDYANLQDPTCDYENRIGPLGWCTHKGLNKANKYKLMVFGNSWTANHAKLFYQECQHKANSILQGSAYGCEPLYAPPSSPVCLKNVTDFANHTEEFKPDYGFMISRFIWLGDPAPGNFTKIEDDPIYKFMKTQLDKLVANVKKKMYILDVMPRVYTNKLGEIVPSIRRGTPMKDIDYHLVAFELYDMARKRYAKLFEECGEKCVRIDYVPEFYRNDTNTFRFFDDKGFSYFTTATHLSPHGLEHIRHVYRDICSKL